MAERVVDLPLDLIDRSPFQPRTEFAEDALAELAQSIRKHGVQQAVVVRTADDAGPIPGGRYELVMGERRVRASRLAEKLTVPAVVRELTDEEAEELALMENLLRENLTPMEEARAFGRLMDRGMPLDRVAEALSKGGTPKSRAYVEFRVRLLNLREEYQDAVRLKILALPQACDLARLPQDKQQLVYGKILAGVNGNEIARIVTAILDLERQQPIWLDEQSGASMRRFADTLEQLCKLIGRFYSRDNVVLLSWVFEGPIETNLQRVSLIKKQITEIEDALKQAKARKTVLAEMSAPAA